MFNITADLIAQPEFCEVRYLKQKIREIGSETHTVAVDNSLPKTFNLSKKLQEHRHVNDH